MTSSLDDIIDDAMHNINAAGLGDLATLGDHGRDPDHPLPFPDDSFIVLNPPRLHPVHPAADSNLELESNFESEAESDSGWGSDLDSDPDTPRPVPAAQLITWQRGRLNCQNRLVHWRPSVFNNYIKFRVYFREWSKGYTYLVPESLLQLLDPFAYPVALQAFLYSRHLGNLQSERLLLRQINNKMGEPQQEFWWRSLAQREKQARTEEEAKHTNEKFGSHDGLSEEIKAHIATKVNDDKISYGQWKKMTKPTSDETYGPSVLDATVAELTKPPAAEAQDPSVLVSLAADLATEQMTSLDIPQIGLTAKQVKFKRRKDRRRAIKALRKSDKLDTTISEPNNSSKLILTKQAADESADKTIDDKRNGNAPMWERTNEKNEEVDEVVPISLSQGNQGSSSIGIIGIGKGKGKAPMPNPTHEETDTASIVSRMNATQFRQTSDITLDKGKGKAVARDSGDMKTNENMDASSKASVHNNQPFDLTINKRKGKAPVKNLPKKKKVQIVDLTSNVIARSEQPSDISLDKEKGRLSSNATAENKIPLDIALDKGEGEISSAATSLDVKTFNIGLAKGKRTPSNNTTVQNTKPLQIVLDAEKEATSNNITAQDVISSGITLVKGEKASPSNAIAQNVTPFDTTLNEEHEASSINVTAQNEKALDITPINGSERPLSDVTAQNETALDITPINGSEKPPSNFTAQNETALDITPTNGSERSPSNVTARNETTLDITSINGSKRPSSNVTAQNQTALDIASTNGSERPSSNVTAQNPLRLNITLDAETGKLSITAQIDRQNGQSVGVASNQNTVPLNITIDIRTGERLITTLLNGQTSQSIDVVGNHSISITGNQSISVTSNQSIDITGNHRMEIASNQNTQPLETILDTRNEKTPISALPDEKIYQSTDTVNKTQNATKHVSQPRSHNLNGNTSAINLAPKTHSSVDFARKVAIPKKEHLDNLLNIAKAKAKGKGKGKAPTENLSDKRIDHSIEMTSPKYKIPSDITLHKENEEKAPIKDLSDKKINQSIDTASKTHNQTVHPSASSSNDLKGKIMALDQTDKPDPSIKVVGKIIAQPSETTLDKGKGKEPTKTLTNNTPDQSAGAASKLKAKTVHFDETLSMNQEGKAPIRNLADKTMAASSNAVSGKTTHEGRDSEASAGKSQGKAQASDSTFENQNFGSSYSSTTQHQLAPFPSRSPLAHVRGARGLKWAYFTHTVADEALIASGIWLFEKPTTYFEYQPYKYVRRGMSLIQAPIAVATYEEDDVHEPYEPSIDVDNIGVWINTHDQPWRDVRSKPTHPDFQPTPKLLEYQACESLGIAVWRHDRNLLNCRLPECKVKTADHNASTMICLGCGPKTITRYCSEAHQFADLGEHWEECGQPGLLMKRVIDATTSPARFGRLWPAIRDRSGNSSYERSRQAMYAAMQHGRYTLFDPETEAPTALIWPMEDERAAVMEGRVERLLNYALFDHKHGRITGLLYRMIRQCLIQKNFWAIGPIHAVKTQFAVEFGCDVSKVAEQPLCECEWVGARVPRDRHVAGCKRLYLAYSAEYQATGIQGFLRMMEGRYWALRAWRQRHPTVDDWDARVSGWGFAGEVDGAAPFLGPGWSGWGSPADDLVA